MEQAKEQKIFTYEDYLNFPENVRQEIINGVVYDMAAPSERHQDFVLEIGSQLRNKLGGKCKAIIAPFTVTFEKPVLHQGESTNVVEPDILVVCNPEKLDGKRCNGAPDIIIEITSSNKTHDFITKSELYRLNGVFEYLVIDIIGEEDILFRQVMDGVLNPIKNLNKDDSIITFKHPLFEGLEINLKDLY